MSDEFDLYSDYEDDVDLNPANKAPSKRTDWYKAEDGKTNRVALLYFHPLPVRVRKAMLDKAAREGKPAPSTAEIAAKAKAVLEKRAADLGKSYDELEEWEKLDTSTAQFKKATSHFKAGLGSVETRMGKDGPEADKVWAQLPEARDNYYSILLVYPTDAHGNLDAQNIGNSVVKPWRFSPTMFNTLIDKEKVLKNYGDTNSLATSDLMFEGKKRGEFVMINVEPAGNAIWLKNDKLKAKFLAAACKLYPKIPGTLQLSTAELREKLNLGGPGGKGGDISADDLNDILIDT